MKRSLQKELENISEAEILTPAYRKRKLRMWAIRTVIAIIMYYFLWDVKWVRWSLWLYVPLNLFLPISLLGGNYFLNKKIEKVNRMVEDLEDSEEE